MRSHLLMAPGLALVGAALGGSIAAAAAGDDLFLPSYQVYTNAAPHNPTPAPAPARAATPAAGSPARPSLLGRARLGWPRVAHAEKAPVEPLVPPPPTAAAGPTVAATLSTPGDPPAYVPPSSRGMIARLKRAEPDVPRGLPRGAEPVVMIPPEPLGPADSPAPLLAAEPDSPAARRPVATTRPTLAARPAGRSPSPFAPFRPIDPPEPAPARVVERRPPAVPPLIARPTEAEADSPVRRVQATPNDLETSATPIPGAAEASATGRSPTP